MKKVAMFVTNPCTHDARVMKEAQSLSEVGYQVRIYALSNSLNAPGLFKQQGYEVHRLQFDNIFRRVYSFFGRLTRWLLRIFLFLSYPLKFLFPARYSSVEHSSNAGGQGLAGHMSSFAFSVSMNRVVRYLRVDLNALLKKFLKFENRRRVLSILGSSFRAARRGYLILKRVSKRFLYRLLLPFHKLSTYYFFCVSAAKEAILWQADVAHAHDLNTMYAAKLVKDQLSAKIVYDSHELWVHRNRVGRRARLEKIVDKWVERKLISEADAVITVCNSIAEWLVKHYSEIPAPIVLRNMPHQLMLAHSVKEDEKMISIKSRLNMPRDALVMVYTGKLTTGRGIKIGMQAVTQLPNLYMVMLGYGEPSYIEEIVEYASSAGIVDRVVICDPVPYSEVTQFIFGADFSLVFIEPVCLSYEFALPNKLFESIQAGIPILGSKLVEIEKLIDEYGIGLCFSSPEDLADKIRDKATPQQLANWRDALQECREELCWDVEQDELINVYKTLSA